MATKIKVTSTTRRPSLFQTYFIKSLIVLALAAIALMWFLEFRYFITDTWKTWRFLYDSPVVFLFNAFILFVGMLVIWAIVGRPGTAIGLTWNILIVVTYIHINKYASRETPLLPEDFALADQASSLSNFVQTGPLIRLILAIILVFVLTFVFNRTLAKKWGLIYENKEANFAKRYLVFERIILFTFSLFLLISSTEFARHNDGARYTDIPFLGTHFTAWNQNRNYDDNGFILGFLYNMQKLDVAEPDNYDEVTMKDIKQQYTDIAKSANKSRIDPADEDISIVIILNESFYDPDVTYAGRGFRDFYQYEGEVTPNLHRIMASTPSGSMYTLDYGGGTANIEFEMFTGLTNYWINAVPYTSLIPKAGNIPSVAQYLKSKDFVTTAIHPYNGGMYKRNISLKNEGFDTFITKSEIENPLHEGDGENASEYINDKTAYAEVLKVLKKKEKIEVEVEKEVEPAEGDNVASEDGSTDEKQVEVVKETQYVYKNQTIGLITMQNHTPFKSETYSNLEFRLQNEDLQDDRKASIETYLQTLHESDKYLGEFIDEIDKLDRKVVVLFFGDHAPGLFDIINGNDIKDVFALSRLTPYFFYANFDNAFTSYDNLPTTTPNCIVNSLYDRLNWKKEAQYYLLDQVCATEPILTQSWIEDRDVDSSLIMQKYMLLTYDILSGKQYWLQQ